MDTDSEPNSKPEELDDLLHRLRSTLARLKAQVELAVADDETIGQTVGSTTQEAIDLLALIERCVGISEPAVLVLDDDAELADLTVRQLIRMGIHASAGYDLRPLRTADPQLTTVLADLTLLRRATPEDIIRLKRFHVIVVSGAVTPSARLEAQGYSARSYLVKPLDMAEVTQLLQHM